MYPPTALKRQAPSSFIFLMTNPFFSWSAFSNQCSCCNRGRISEETQWEFIIMCSVNRQTSNEKVIVGNIYFAHLKLSRASQRSSYFMHQQDQNSYRLYNHYIRLNNTILSIFFNHCTWFINNDQCVGKDRFEYEKQGLRRKIVEIITPMVSMVNLGLWCILWNSAQFSLWSWTQKTIRIWTVRFSLEFLMGFWNSVYDFWIK